MENNEQTVTQTEQTQVTRQVNKKAIVLFIVFVGLLIGYFTLKDDTQNKKNIEVSFVNQSLSKDKKAQIASIVAKLEVKNFYSLNLKNILVALKQPEWVENVAIKKVYPNKLYVNVESYKPVARFGSERLMDSKGKVFYGDNQDRRRARVMPYFYGPEDKTKDMMDKYIVVQKWFKKSGLNIKEVSLNEKMTWTFVFTNGLILIADKNKTDKKLYSLSKLMTTKLLSVKNDIRKIDLRYPNGFAILWKKTPKNVKVLVQ